MKLSRASEAEDEDLTSVWIVTYSDMITLLLCFFFVIYSFTVFGEQKQRELVQALNKVTEAAPAARAAAKAEDLERTAREIAARFGTTKGEQPWVDATEAEVTVGLPSSVTFAVGEATLTAPAEEQLRAVAAILSRIPNLVRVEGHTDDRPLRGRGQYRSNWHLSVARSQSVARLFIGQRLDPHRIQVVGFGETRPRHPNTTDENRRLNRRIEIKLVRTAKK